MTIKMTDIEARAFHVIKTEGIVRFLYRAVVFVLSWIIFILLYPVFWVMNIRVIPIKYYALGHMAIEPDMYVKEGILGLRPLYRSLLLVPPRDVANRHLLQYWKKYFWVIDNPVLWVLLGKLGRSRLTTYDVDKYQVAINKNAAYPAIQKQYYGRPSLLTLTETDRARGWDELKKLGVPQDAWFVCVHCREGGSTAAEPVHSLRDVDVNNYVPAMEEIVRRGGWVFRMGDAGMKPIPLMPQVIDYAHLDIKSDWMDIFLCASCRFCIRTASGLGDVPTVFGVPGVMTNAVLPLSVILPFGPQDIGISKLIRSSKDGRYLTFKEVFASPIGNYRWGHQFVDNGLEVVEKSSEDIKAVTIEMLDRLEGRFEYSQEDDRMQARYKSLMNETHYSYGAMARIGKDFLRKHEALL